MERVVSVNWIFPWWDGEEPIPIVFHGDKGFANAKDLVIRKMREDAADIRGWWEGLPCATNEADAIDSAADELDVMKYESNIDRRFQIVRYWIRIDPPESPKMPSDANGTLGSAIGSGR